MDGLFTYHLSVIILCYSSAALASSQNRYIFVHLSTTSSICLCCNWSSVYFVKVTKYFKISQVCNLILICLLSGKRRYDRKQSGYGGQTKPIFHKKVYQKLLCPYNHRLFYVCLILVWAIRPIIESIMQF